MSKRFLKLKNLIKNKNYSIDKAFLLLKELHTTKFIESVEAHINLNINNKNIQHHIHSSLILPHNTKKNICIAVFIEDNLASNILKMGADIAGTDNLISDILNNNIKFDILITTPILIPKLIKLGKILGPKGLMPSIKNGTVTQNIYEAITEFKKGKFEYKTDKSGIIHILLGSINFSIDQLKENLFAIYKSINKNKPINFKGLFFKSIYICTTMSPSIKIEINSLK